MRRLPPCLSCGTLFADWCAGMRAEGARCRSIHARSNKIVLERLSPVGTARPMGTWLARAHPSAASGDKGECLHTNGVVLRSPGSSRFAAHPGEMLERERGILKGCDRTDVASPWHGVSPTCLEWMDRVRRGRVLGCRILSDPVGVAGDLVWSPRGGYPRR